MRMMQSHVSFGLTTSSSRQEAFLRCTHERHQPGNSWQCLSRGDDPGSGILQAVLAVDRVMMCLPQLCLADRKSPLQKWNGLALSSLQVFQICAKLKGPQ